MRLKEQPAADELLGIARDTVLEVLLPQLPPDAHYAARMVANALAIARREHAAKPLAPELAAELRALAAESDIDSAGPELVRRIRDGAFDGDPAAQARLDAALQHWTRARVAIGNPRWSEAPAVDMS